MLGCEAVFDGNDDGKALGDERQEVRGLHAAVADDHPAAVEAAVADGYLNHPI